MRSEGTTLATKSMPIGPPTPKEDAMARRAKEIIGRRLVAVDGDVGKTKDVFFDDGGWNIRYLVVDTGSWLSSREVLVSPVSVERVDPADGTIHTRLTREQVEQSPPVLAD